MHIDKSKVREKKSHSKMLIIVNFKDDNKNWHFKENGSEIVCLLDCSDLPISKERFSQFTF